MGSYSIFRVDGEGNHSVVGPYFKTLSGVYNYSVATFSDLSGLMLYYYVEGKRVMEKPLEKFVQEYGEQYA